MKEERSKFNVDGDKQKRTHNGIIFDSAMEMKYYRDVVLPQVESGGIRSFELQKAYELQPKFTYGNRTVLPIVYVADFYIEYSDGRQEVVEVKGCPDSLALTKRKMFWYVYPNITYTWVCFSKVDGGWCDYEYVKAARSRRRKEKRAAQKIANEEKEK